MSFNSHSPITKTSSSSSSSGGGGIERSNTTTAAVATTGTTTTTTGQVKSIKNKFENLNNTLVVLDNADNILLSKKCPNIPSYKLQRASTSFELLTKKHSIPTNTKQIINNVRLPIIGGNHPYFEQKPQQKSTNIIIKRQASDSFLLKKPSSSSAGSSISSSSRKLSGTRIFKPLTEIKENFEQTPVDSNTRNDIGIDGEGDGDGDDGDPLLKRSNNIIKRSPAFRFGDKQNKVQLTKLSPVIADGDIGGDDGQDTEAAHEIEFKNKFEKFFNEAIGTPEYRVTDTIRAALKQPLPTGPPPKKPPRLFDTNLLNTKNNHNTNNDIVQIFEINNNKKNNKTSTTPTTSNTTTTTTNDKKPNHINNSNHNRIEQLKKFTKQHIIKSNSTESSKSEKSVNNFLNCIQCTNSIYEQKLTQYTKMNTNDTAAASKEPIYMEPYGHLNSSTSSSLQFNKSINDCGEMQNKNGNNNTDDHHKEIAIMFEKSDSNGHHQHHSQEQYPQQSCACQHGLNKDSDLLHYMCTKIDDQFKPHNNSTDNDAINTYDEINILVNAAFEEPSPTVTPTTTTTTADSGHCSIETISSQSNIDLLNHHRSSPIKISRSLTDKRKNYVRRVSQKNPNHCSSMTPSAYGSLIDQSYLNKTSLSTFLINDNNGQRTDKTIETINPIINNNNNNNNNNEDENGNEKIVSDRINKFNQLINDSNVSGGNNSQHQSPIKKSPIKLESPNNKLIKNESQLLLPDNKTHKLFQMCLLIGFNVSTNSAYIKLKFPCDEDPPKNIEQLVFPDNFNGYTTTTTNAMMDGAGGCLNALHQDYSLILTDFNGYRIYAYCRRIRPETSEICLPLAYCIITEQRAPGFYFKLLKEIESRHGYTDFQINSLLTNLQIQILPEPGKFLHMKLPVSPRPKTVIITNPSITKSYQSITKKRLSLETNPKWLTETAVYEAFGNGSPASNSNTDNNNNNNNSNNCTTSDKHLKLRDEFKKMLIEDNSNNSNNSNNQKTFDFGLINRSLLESTRCGAKIDEVLISRPHDIHLESTELSDIFTALGGDLLITVFGSLLHERKVILYSKNISLLSSCILGLQTILYPFQWQYTLVTLLPNDLLEICQAPVPILVGILEDLTVDIEDGIYINLDLKMIVQSCGDEATILPTQLKDSLLLSLKLVNMLDHGKMLSSVLIGKAFLRFYVELFAGYTSKQFEKESFIKSHPSQSVRLFLEWFVETAMFRHFVNSKYFNMPKPTQMEETIYAQFENGLMDKIENKTKTNQSMGTILKNCKIINKKGKSFFKFFK